MNDVIDVIVKRNVGLFGEKPDVKKVNVGFTNVIYIVNDKFVVKICSNINNEDNFRKEIDFYKANIGNDLIPKLYFSDVSKKDVSYFYEVMEHVDGISLYNVWHTFDDEERENVIRQLCEVMRGIHANKGKKYDWCGFLREKFDGLLNEISDKGIFGEEEFCLVKRAYEKFPIYLASDDFVLVHNDLHFDNVFYKDGKIKLIDFERSMYAPRDFELDILFRMVRKPWKFASEETEPFVDAADYSSIRLYVEKYYPEIVSGPFLEQRLAIYDMVYYTKSLIEYPNLQELKDDVLAAAKVVCYKDELDVEEDFRKLEKR